MVLALGTTLLQSQKGSAWGTRAMTLVLGPMGHQQFTLSSSESKGIFRIPLNTVFQADQFGWSELLCSVKPLAILRFDLEGSMWI